MSARTRTWRPAWPCPVATVLRQQRRGMGDPTYRIDGAGRHWRAMRTPEGPASLGVAPLDAQGEVHAEAWGPGAGWALDRLPTMLGADDDVSDFVPGHPVLHELHRRRPHLRFGATGLVMESLLPTIIEQKVTGQEAFGGFAALVRRHGEPAPGPMADAGLRLQPTPEQVRRLPSWEWLDLHVDPARSRAAVLAAQHASALERPELGSAELDRRLRSLRGLGIWTSAEVRQRVLGDADAVSFFDYHVAKDIGWALTGAPVDDVALEQLLEPWRPHRARVQVLVASGGLGAPRRGARMAPRTHLPGRTPGTRRSRASG